MCLCIRKYISRPRRIPSGAPSTQTYHAAKVSSSSHILENKTKKVYRAIPRCRPLVQHLSMRGTLAASTHDIVKHAAPDLLDDADLLLNRLLDRGHEVSDSVEIDAVGVAVV